MKLKLKIEGGGGGLSDLLAFRAYSLLVAFAASSQFFFCCARRLEEEKGRQGKSAPSILQRAILAPYLELRNREHPRAHHAN